MTMIETIKNITRGDTSLAAESLVNASDFEWGRAVAILAKYIGKVPSATVEAEAALEWAQEEAAFDALAETRI